MKSKARLNGIEKLLDVASQLGRLASKRGRARKARYRLCYNCRGRGHLASECTSPPMNAQSEADSECAQPPNLASLAPTQLCGAAILCPNKPTVNKRKPTRAKAQANKITHKSSKGNIKSDQNINRSIVSTDKSPDIQQQILKLQEMMQTYTKSAIT